MAEEEKIREHAKQALQALTDKKKGWKEKIKDFLWEILIIVVAINLTLWFHNWSDKRLDRELEKDFLIGTRNDMNGIMHELDSGVVRFQPILDYYDSVWTQINEHRIDKAFVDTNSWKLREENYFVYNNSRFESFKSSGYLRLIENHRLSEEITYLYTAILPFQLEADKSVYDKRESELTTYISSKVRMDYEGNMYVSEILNNPEVKNQIYMQGTALYDRRRQKKRVITMG